MKPTKHKKRARGRPPIKPADRRSENINLRVSKAVKRELEAKAEAEGITLTEYVLRRLTEEE